MNKINFSSITENILLFLSFLLPLFFLPFTADLFDFNKRFLFMFATALLLFLGAIQVLLRREVRFTRNPWTLPLVFFGIATVATILLVSPNKISALLGNGGMYLSFVLFIITATNLIERNFTRKLMTALSFCAVVVTLTTLIDRFGVSLAQVINQAFSLNIPDGTKLFLTGSPLFSIFFLGVVGLMLFIRFLQTRSTGQGVTNIIFAVICIIGITINAESILPGKPTHPQFLGTLDSWSIATDVLKTPLNAALGVGTDSYANAYSVFRPLRLNQSPIWFVRFNNARNSMLELLTTQGVLGTAMWALILLTSLRLIRTARDEQLPLGIGVLAIQVLLLFFPPNILLLGLLAIFLSAWGASLKERKVRTTQTTLSLFALADFSQLNSGSGAAKGQKVVAIGFGLALSIAIILLAYGLSRAYAAEYYFARYLVATTSNQSAKEIYDNGVKSIQLNPFMENYRRSFALANMSIAQALSQNEKLNDADKQNILALIQQAIAQAKVATNLDPLNTANWDALSNVYTALIGSAEGAGDWTIASYVEQIKTDPTNPEPRFDLGNVYRQGGNDDMAIQLYQQAAQLKSDYAKAYYAMSEIYKKKGDKVNELAMLKATLSLLTPEQQGYDTVNARISELESDKGGSTKETKSTTKPSPTPVVNQVDLPGEVGLPSSTSVPEIPEQ